MKKNKLLKTITVGSVSLGVLLTANPQHLENQAQANESGWEKQGNTWYYYKNGNLVKNAWQGSYYLKSDGKMAASEWIYDSDYKAWYYLKSDGSYARNEWVGNYWLNSNGKMATNSWVDKGRYYVGSNGAWVPQAATKNGWEKQGSTWYYYKNGNLVRNSWAGSYYLKSDGKMASSEWIYDNSYRAWYYLKSDGSYARNEWAGNYWLNSNGKMATSSWVDNNRYYVGSNGAWVPQTAAKDGWIKEGGSWYYYINGEQQKDTWQGDYYLKYDGKMATNEWVGAHNNRYYVGDNGKLARPTTANTLALKYTPKEKVKVTHSIHAKCYATCSIHTKLSKSIPEDSFIVIDKLEGASELGTKDREVTLRFKDGSESKVVIELTITDLLV